MNKYSFTYFCRLTNSLSIYVEADCREDADDMADDILRQGENLGLGLPALHSFECVVQKELQ